MDGPTPFAISKMNKSNDQYSFDYIMPYEYEEGLNKSQLSIYIVDSKLKIAVWEYKNSEGTEYKLNIPSNYAHHFDMIVNYSPLCKAREIELDEPDYKLLLYKFQKENK